MEEIGQAAENQSLLVCTDGSYDPNKSMGAHSWVFSTPNNKLWQWAGPSDGHQKLSSPNQAELSGLVTTLYILYKT
jgi:hypothetical protein